MSASAGSRAGSCQLAQAGAYLRDFQTTGVVAFARGCPFYRLASGRLDVMGQRIQVNEPQRQLAVLSRIHDLILDDSQFIIATHSPILMAYPDACIYHCTVDGISQVAYEDTEHFQVTRDFLSNPQRMLRVLLER